MSDRAPDRSHTAPPGELLLAPGVAVREADLRFTFSRSSGPGGQAVNKLSTKAELRVAIQNIHGLDDTAIARLRRLAGRRLTSEDDIVIQSDQSRSQRMNRNHCIDRLKELVLRAVTVPKRRKKTKPSRAANERRLKQKREQSEKKSLRQSKPQ